MRWQFYWSPATVATATLPWGGVALCAWMVSFICMPVLAVCQCLRVWVRPCCEPYALRQLQHGTAVQFCQPPVCCCSSADAVKEGLLCWQPRRSATVLPFHLKHHGAWHDRACTSTVAPYNRMQVMLLSCCMVNLVRISIVQLCARRSCCLPPPSVFNLQTRCGQWSPESAADPAPCAGVLVVSSRVAQVLRLSAAQAN